MTLLAPMIALALAGAPATSAPASTLRFEVNRVAAVVNGDVITMRELERAGGEALRDANLLAPGPDRDKARAEALRAAFDLLVADRLFSQQVKKLDLQVSDAQVDAQIEAIKEQNHFTDEQLDAAIGANYKRIFDWYREVMGRVHFSGLIRPVHPEFYRRSQSEETAAAATSGTRGRAPGGAA